MGIEAIGHEGLAQIDGADVIVQADGADLCPRRDQTVEPGTLRRCAHLLQQQGGQILPVGQVGGDALTDEIAVGGIGVVYGMLAMEAIHAVVTQIQLVQGKLQRGFAVEASILGGEDQPCAAGQGQESAGHAGGGEGQLHTAQVGQLRRKMQIHGVSVDVPLGNGTRCWDQAFQLLAQRSLEIERQNGIEIILDARQLPGLRGDDAVGAGKVGVRAVVIKADGGAQLLLGAAEQTGSQDGDQDQGSQSFHSSSSTSKTGKVRVKVVPVGGTSELVTVMEPRFRSTISLTMARPRPLPPVWRERALSTR